MKLRRRSNSKINPSSVRRRSLFERLEDRSLLAVLNPVSDTSAFPYSAVVQLNSVWDSNGNGELDPPTYNAVGQLTSGDRRNTCSGAMVSPYQVLTAAHCVFKPDNGGMAQWTFAHPGRASLWDRPFGEARALDWHVPSSYLSSTNEYFDVAVVALDRNIGDETGWFGLKSIEEPRDPGPNYSLRPEPLQFHVNVLHYPAKHQYAGKDLSGTEQFQGDTNYTLFPESWVIPGLDPQYFIDMKTMWTTKGSSGAPLFDDQYHVIGVLQGGSDIPLGQSGTDYYTKFNGSQAFPLWWIKEALDFNNAPSDRLSLVNRDAWLGDPEANLQTLDVGVGEELTFNAPILNVGTREARTIDPLDEINDRIPLYLNRVLLKGKVTESQHGYNVKVKYADDSMEPNDTRGTATLLPSSQWLSDVRDTGIQYDTDFYKVVVPSGHSVLSAELTFNHEDGDIDLDLQDAAGTRLVSSQGYEDIEHLQVLVTPGTYYLRVHHGNEGNLYDLRWESTSAADLVATEISATSLPVEAGQEVDVRFRIANLGLGEATPFETAIYLSRDIIINPDTDILIGRKVLSALSGNATSSH